jgi:hypothetical protein
MAADDYTKIGRMINVMSTDRSWNDGAMPSVTLRFYEELNDFLPAGLSKKPVVRKYPPGCTAKAIIEDLGVPHTEVDLLLVNGQSVDFSYRLRDGDLLSVYPVFESWDIIGLSRVRSEPLRETRFILDVHLGKLARLLVMFGFDASYRSGADDEELVRTARRESRIVLTRDRGLLKRRLVTHGYLVRSDHPREQVAEIIRRFDLARAVHLFGRCMRCNIRLAPCTREAAAPLVPRVVGEVYSEFSRCPSCGRVFWKGSHWESMQRLAAEVRSGLPGSDES